MESAELPILCKSKPSFAEAASLDADTTQSRTTGAASSTLPFLKASLHFARAVSKPEACSTSLKKLQYKQQILEHEGEKDLLVQQEREGRSLLVIHETDGYELLRHQYERSLARFNYETAIIRETRLYLEAHSFERRQSHDREQEDLKDSEQDFRAQVEKCEIDDRAFIVSMRELHHLKIQRELSTNKKHMAVARHAKAMHVRQHELENFKRYYRSPKSFHLLQTTDPFHAVSLAQEGLRDGKRILSRVSQHRTRLMLYSLFEEEFFTRTEICCDHELNSLALECLKAVALLTLHEEPLARGNLEALLRFGASQVRLSFVVRIQRWWRFSQRHPWSVWRRKALMEDLAVVPRARPKSGLMQESSGLKSRPAEESSLVVLEKAATLHRYNILLDLYRYRLGVKLSSFLNQQRNFFNISKSSCSDESAMVNYLHVLSQFSLLSLCRPRYRLPYDSWRHSRWDLHKFDRLTQPKTFTQAEANAARAS